MKDILIELEEAYEKARLCPDVTSFDQLMDAVENTLEVLKEQYEF